MGRSSALSSGHEKSTTGRGAVVGRLRRNRVNQEWDKTTSPGPIRAGRQLEGRLSLVGQWPTD
jgi:hypothetical protein